jgi:hypothetical protein
MHQLNLMVVADLTRSANVGHGGWFPMQSADIIYYSLYSASTIRNGGQAAVES